MIIHPTDTVEVRLEDGHKVALRDIKAGEKVIKYGHPIGVATEDIPKGAHVHTHNLRSGLSEFGKYAYLPNVPEKTTAEPLAFQGYVRENGEVGIRNDVWIVNTVGCVNALAQTLAQKTGALCFPHPYGCSQLGDDHHTTQLVLRGLINHPNAGGVLVLGLGCENNNIDVFREVLGEYDPRRVRFLNAQDCADEVAEGVAIIKELQAYADTFKRETLPFSRLKIGLKCGGSDAYSGITANPLVGCVCDRMIAMGGSCVMTEVPEMFGAEHLLMERCESQEIFDRYVTLINDFKAYFVSHGQEVYENPSPGNRKGGITTLEEKSLGCVQKGGHGRVVDILNYGDTVQKPGLSLLNGPGNDAVAVTNLTAAGCHIILFTTGRGTPLGSPVPTLKIATNHSLAERKANWIDFDASPLLEGVTFDTLTEQLLQKIGETANGALTKSEQNGCHDIAIFKDGVTL